jgi:pimeloyl-ACP methyl ester carboxylesterase
MPALGPVVDHLERSVGHVDVVELADAGHTAHVSHPEAFADLVRRAVALAGRPAGR